MLPLLANILKLTKGGDSLASQGPITLAYAFIYMLVGVLVFSTTESKDCEGDDVADGCTESWTVTDSLYFSVVVMSTVGYGDFSPSHLGTRVFVIFYLFFGIVIVFSNVASCMGMIMNPVVDLMRDKVEVWFPQEGIDVNGNGEADYKAPREWYIYYPKMLMPSILITFLFQQLSAAIYSAIEGWNYGEASYHCWVTAATVGFGDMSIATDGGRWWAIIHISISVCLLAAFISDIEAVRIKRRLELNRKALLLKKMDVDLISSLDKDKTGVDKMEFVTGMLIKLGIVEEKDVELFLKQFDRLDKTKTNRITFDDLALAIEEEQRRIDAALVEAEQKQKPSRFSYHASERE